MSTSKPPSRLFRQSGPPDWAIRFQLRIMQICAASLDTVFPPQCLCCHDRLLRVRYTPLCLSCRRQLQKRPPHWCLRCALPLAMMPGTPARCVGCQDLRFPFTAACAIGPYRDLMRDAIILAKRPEYMAVARMLGHLMVTAQRQHDANWRPDIVTEVPTHWLRRAMRGYCTAEVMAETVARRMKVPNLPLLRCPRATRKQGTLSAAERLQNVAGAFTAKSRYALDGKKVLLVDDVLTTGATATAAAKALRSAGAVEVRVLVAARGTGPAFT